MILSRRGLLAGLGAAIAAPAIIRTPGLLMPVRRVPLDLGPVDVGPLRQRVYEAVYVELRRRAPGPRLISRQEVVEALPRAIASMSIPFPYRVEPSQTGAMATLHFYPIEGAT